MVKLTTLTDEVEERQPRQRARSGRQAGRRGGQTVGGAKTLCPITNGTFPVHQTGLESAYELEPEYQ